MDFSSVTELWEARVLALSVYHKRFGHSEQQQHAKGQTVNPYVPCTAELHPVTRINSLRRPFILFFFSLYLSLSLSFSFYPGRSISIFVPFPTLLHSFFLSLLSSSAHTLRFSQSVWVTPRQNVDVNIHFLSRLLRFPFCVSCSRVPMKFYSKGYIRNSLFFFCSICDCL